MVGGIVEAWWKIAKMRTFAWWIFETGELLNLKKQLPSHKREVQLGPQRFEALPWVPQRNLEEADRPQLGPEFGPMGLAPRSRCHWCCTIAASHQFGHEHVGSLCSKKAESKIF